MKFSRGLLILSVIAALIAAYGLSDHDRLARFLQARREAVLSAEAKEIVLGLIVLAIGAYLAWFTFFRRD